MAGRKSTIRRVSHRVFFSDFLITEVLDYSELHRPINVSRDFNTTGTKSHIWDTPKRLGPPASTNALSEPRAPEQSHATGRTPGCGRGTELASAALMETAGE